MILLFFAYLILIFAAFALLIFVVDRSIRSKGYRGPASDHFNGHIFLNIKDKPSLQTQGFWKILKWMLSRSKNVWEQRDVSAIKPVERVMGDELVATLVNHATVLIQTEGLNVITDPIYSRRASPFTFAGPRRFAAPGITFDNLPPIDAVLISHNHYDHLDLATLRRLMKRDNPQILVPLGNKVFLESHGITNVLELDWWNSTELSTNVSVHCVPAQHFSARALSDRNTTLWSGYAIHTPHGDIYFAGDTGNGPFIERIAERFPNGFRLGLLPIGAYRPEWFMSEVHISPDEAYAIQNKLKVSDAVAIHFGTFKLADDGQDEPANRIREILSDSPSPQRFHLLANGESLQL